MRCRVRSAVCVGSILGEGKRGQWGKPKRGQGRRTHDTGVIDEVVEPGLPKDRLEQRGERADAVEVARVELHDVQRPLRGVFEAAECSCFVGRAAGGDDEVGGGLEQLPDDLEADAAGGTRCVGECIGEWWEERGMITYPVTSQVVGRVEDMRVVGERG